MNEMDRACSMYWGRGEVYIVLWWGNMRERATWETEA